MYIFRITGFLGLIFSVIFFFQLSAYFFRKSEIIFLLTFLILIAITIYTFTPSFILERILKKLGKKKEEKELVDIKSIIGTSLFIMLSAYTIFTKYFLPKHLKYDFPLTSDRIHTLEYANVEQALQGKTLLSFHHINKYTNKNIDIDGEKIVPLTFPPFSHILLCKNYSAGLIHYQSDRFGFRNRDEIWEKNPDIIVLGSYAVQGFCTDNPFLEKVSEALEINILNLGKGETDPLISFAIFREFAYDLSPQIIFLFVTQSDVLSISKSYQDDLLKLYLKREDFRQGLKELLKKPEVQFKIESEFRKYEINERQKDFEREGRRKESEKVNSFPEKLFLFFRTGEFISFLAKKLERPKKITDLDLMILALTLKEFRLVSKKIGAKFIVVYIPEEIEISKGFFSNYRKVKSLVQKLNIKFYDLIEKIEEHKRINKQEENLTQNYHLLLAEEFKEIIKKEIENKL